ncbi:cupin domain protein [Xylogone sp. PMI_703]|nr:cupin domain protein [Xylogone sp. PMI_703]
MSNVITYNKNRPAPGIKPVFQYKLADNPALTVLGLLVNFSPDASTPPHRHGTASVAAYVVKGELLNAMNDGEPAVFKEGESWYEAPGCHHRISDNNSKTEDATLLATFIIKTEILEKEGMDVLVQIDPEYLEDYKEQVMRVSS